MALTDAQAKIINQTKKKKEKTKQKAASSNPSVKSGSLTLGGSSQLSPLQLAKQDATTNTTVRNKVDNAKQSKASINTQKSVQANKEKQTAKAQLKSSLNLSESDAKLPSASQKGILDAKVAYEQAKTAGNKEGMAKAHQQAEKIRSRFGYSGGVAGDEKKEGPGLTEKDKVTLNKTGQQALLSALTLGNKERAEEIRNAKGFQAVDHSQQKDGEGREVNVGALSKEQLREGERRAQDYLYAAMAAVPGSIMSAFETADTSATNKSVENNREYLQDKANRLGEYEAKLKLVQSGEGIPEWGSESWLEQQIKIAKNARNLLSKGTEVDTFRPGHTLLRESNEAAARAMEGVTGPGALLAKAGLSAAQMLPGVAASFIPGVGPALGATILGTQAAGSKMYELNEQTSRANYLSKLMGGSPEDYGAVASDESLVRGTVSGAIEGIAGRLLPIGNLLKIVKGNGGASFLVNIAKQAGVEATEESASTVLNHLADLAAKDPNASLTLGEVAEAAAVGAISGAGFGAGGSVLNSAINRNQQKTGLDTLLETAGVRTPETPQNEPEQTFEQPQQETPAQAETPVQEQELGETAMQRLAQRHADVMARIQTAQDSGTLDQVAYDGFVQELNAINAEEARLAQQERQESGQVSRNFGQEESHIDNRTVADVSARNVKAFQFDHPQLHQYFAEAAQALKTDAEYSFASQRAERGTGTIVQRSEQLARAEGLGLTRQEIVDACDAIINDKGQENYAAAKKVELILDEMLSKGYVPNDGGFDSRVEANQGYIRAKQAIPGAVTGFDQYMQDNSLALELGETTEEELRAEFEAMGAASEGFDPYTNAMNKYGTIAPGENPARIIDVPKSTDGTDKVSKFARNLLEAEVTTEPTIKRVEKMIMDQGFSYKPKKDKQSLEKAINVIENYGIDPALAQWQEVVDGRRSAGKDDIVLAETLYINAELTGDTELASRLAAEIAAEGTRMGQGIQALRLLKKATKEGRVYYIRKSVEYVKQELQGRMGDKAKDISIPDELIQEYMDAQGKAAEDEALDKIYTRVAEQIPPTLNDRITAWRYFAMLGNPKTHLKNMLGNVLFGGLYKGSNQVSALIQRAALAEADRTRSFMKDDAARDFAKADWEEVKGILSGDKYNSAYTSIQRKVQENSLGVFNRPAKFSSDKMNQADTWAKKGQYISSMARFITARGWDPANLTKEQLETARSHAILDAQRATFTEASDLADTLSKLEQKGKAWNVAIGATMPFKGVPINIAKQGFNFSAPGLLKSLSYDLYKVKKGERTAAEAIDHISQGLTGTSIAALGLFLASQGILNGMDSDDEKERLLDEATGEQEYSLDLEVLGDKLGLDGPEYTYTIDWMAPAALPLFFGAEVYQGIVDAAAELGEEDFPPSKAFEIALNAAVKTFEPMMNMTVVSGISDVVRAAAYNQNNAPVGIVTEMVEGFMGQFVPTLLGQIARTIDDTRRSTFGDKNKGFTGFQKFIQQQGNKIPGLSQKNVPYLNVWGETEDTGNVLLRALENAVSPGYIAKKTGGSTEAELKRLHEAGYEGVLPGMVEKSAKVNDKYVTADQWVNMQTTRGKTAKSVLDSFIGTEQYNAMTDDERAKFVKKVLEYGSNMGKVKGGAEAEETFARWQEAAKNAKAEVGLSEAEIIAASAYQSVLGEDAGDETKASIKQGMYEQWVNDRTDLNDEQKAYLKNNIKFYQMIPADASSYNKAVEAGYTTPESIEALLSGKKEYDFDGNASYTNTEMYAYISSLPEGEQEMAWNALRSKGTTKSWATLKSEEAPKLAKQQKAQETLNGSMEADRQAVFANAISEYGTGSRYAVYQALMSIDATDAERQTYYNYVNAKKGWKASWAQMKANGGYP